MKKLIATTALVLGLGAFVNAEETLTAASDLVDVSNGIFRETQIDPGVDFSQYDKIMIEEGYFEFRDVEKSSTTAAMVRSNKTDFWISDEDKQKIVTDITDVFGTHITKSEHFEIVTEAGPGVLVLTGGLNDIVSHVPPQQAGVRDSYVTKIGTATVIVEARDSQTGKIVFRTSERSDIERPGRQMIKANSVEVKGELRRWARRMTGKLVAGLDDIHS